MDSEGTLFCVPSHHTWCALPEPVAYSGLTLQLHYAHIHTHIHTYTYTPLTHTFTHTCKVLEARDCTLTTGLEPFRIKVAGVFQRRTCSARAVLVRKGNRGQDAGTCNLHRKNIPWKLRNTPWKLRTDSDSAEWQMWKLILLSLPLNY